MTNSIGPVTAHPSRFWLVIHCWSGVQRPRRSPTIHRLPLRPRFLPVHKSSWRQSMAAVTMSWIEPSMMRGYSVAVWQWFN